MDFELAINTRGETARGKGEEATARDSVGGNNARHVKEDLWRYKYPTRVAAILYGLVRVRLTLSQECRAC
jgi:hypothetical protein